MDIAFLLNKYFKGKNNVSIDVFDAQTLNTVYRNVIHALTSHFEIEVSVLQALSYCLYEIMDNVHIHSGKPLGTAITYYNDSCHTIHILLQMMAWGCLLLWRKTTNSTILQSQRL